MAWSKEETRIEGHLVSQHDARAYRALLRAGELRFRRAGGRGSVGCWVDRNGGSIDSLGKPLASIGQVNRLVACGLVALLNGGTVAVTAKRAAELVRGNNAL